MEKMRCFGISLALALLLLPGCSGGKTATTQSESASAGGTGNTSSDDKITKAVQDKLDADPSLKSDGIKAKATGGQVELTGTVKAIADKDKAETIANDAIKPFASVNAGVVDSITIADSSSSGAGAPSASGNK